MMKISFETKINEIATILKTKKAELPDMTGMDWAYDHNWISEEEMNKARHKEIILNIWRDFAFIILSDLKINYELEFLVYFEKMINFLKKFKDNSKDITEMDFLDRNINHLMYYSADFKKLNEIEIFNFLNAFVESFRILQEKN